jgi:hypothetical protein
LLLLLLLLGFVCWERSLYSSYRDLNFPLTSEEQEDASRGKFTVNTTHLHSQTDNPPLQGAVSSWPAQWQFISTFKSQPKLKALSKQIVFTSFKAVPQCVKLT